MPKDDWLPRKGAQTGLDPRSHIVASLTGAAYKCNRRQLKVLDYTSTPTISTIPWPFTDKKDSALCPTLVYPHEVTPKKRTRFNLTTYKTPEWHTTDSEEPPRKQLYQINLYPLWQKNPIHNLLFTYLWHQVYQDWMHSSLNPRQLLVNLPEAPPTEPKIPPIQA